MCIIGLRLPSMFHKKNNYLKEILSTLHDSGVEYIVCGGVALVLHGVERMTLDLDLSLNMNSTNLGRFLHAMKKLGLTPRAPVPAESIMDENKRLAMIREKNAVVFSFIDTRNPYRQVDVFLTDRFSYEQLSGHADTVSVGDISVKLVSKKKLLEMKKAIKPLRDKDRFDIQSLEKLLKKAGSDHENG